VDHVKVSDYVQKHTTINTVSELSLVSDLRRQYKPILGRSELAILARVKRLALSDARYVDCFHKCTSAVDSCWGGHDI
jgi:hypothetical protein